MVNAPRTGYNYWGDISIIMEGTGEPVEVLASLDGAINRASRYWSKSMARQIAQRAYQKAPKDRGWLAGSIKAVKHDSRSWKVVVGNDVVDYAIFVEYGTYKMSPRPFIRPAIDEAIGPGKQTLANMIWSDRELRSAMNKPFRRVNTLTQNTQRSTVLGGYSGIGPTGSSQGLTGAFSGNLRYQRVL